MQDTLFNGYLLGFDETPEVIAERCNPPDGKGTGRFTHASGGGVEIGSVNFNDFSFTVSMTGVIAYKKK